MIHVRRFTTNPAEFLVPVPLGTPAHRISVEIHKALLKQKGNTVWRDISTDKEENFWVELSTRFSQLEKIVAVLWGWLMLQSYLLYFYNVTGSCWEMSYYTVPETFNIFFWSDKTPSLSCSQTVLRCAIEYSWATVIHKADIFFFMMRNIFLQRNWVCISSHNCL